MRRITFTSTLHQHPSPTDRKELKVTGHQVDDHHDQLQQQNITNLKNPFSKQTLRFPHI